MNIALYGKSFSVDRSAYLRQLVDGLRKNGVKLAVYKPFYELIKPHIFPAEHDIVIFSTHDELVAFADMVCSVGGDGTLLDTLPLIRNSNIPVIGINMGRLGFLSSISKQEIDHAVNQLIAGKYTLEKRSLIQLKNPPDLFPVINYALNELTIFRKETTSLIVVQVYVDDQFVNAY